MITDEERGKITKALSALAWCSGWLEGAMMRLPEPNTPPAFIQESIDALIPIVAVERDHEIPT